MSLAERVVGIAGITMRPDEAWMLQMGRNLTDCETGALRSAASDRRLAQQVYDAVSPVDPGWRGTTVIRLPPRSPNLNAYAERFVRSIKDECLNRMIFVGQASLRRGVSEYVKH